MSKIICAGNDCKCSSYTMNGCADYTIILSFTGENECCVVFEDGLYKLFQNDTLVMAATSALIHFYDKTKCK